MAKTVYSDTPPTGTIVTAAFLNALNNQRHTGRDIDGEGALDYAASTGSANAYVLTLSPALDAHIAGMPIMMKANHSNTGAATVNINSMGAVAIKRPNGDALQADDIISGQIIILVYDGTNYQLVTLATPEVVAADFAAALNQNGYQKLPSGYIEQWGLYNSSITSEEAVNITFPMEFPDSCLNLTLTGINSASNSNRDGFMQVVSVTATGATCFLQAGAYSNARLDGFFWRAIGK